MRANPLTTFLASPTFVLLLLALPTPAQDPDKPPPPLTVTAQFSANLTPNCDSGQGLLVHLRYSGELPLRGYLVKFVLANAATGKPLQQQILQEICDARDPMLLDGADWSRTLCPSPFPAADPPTVTASVDVLKFADGSIWGPATLPQSHYLIGTIDGLDFSVKSTDLQKFVSPISVDQGPLPTEDLQSQTLGPLKFQSGVWRDEAGKELLAVTATNLSSIPIRAYVFTASFFDAASGNRLRRVTTKQLETHGNPADFLAPGATWVAAPRKFSRSADGSLAKYTITLDLVVFADHSTFGPTRSQESNEVLGMLHGIDAANHADTLKRDKSN